MFFIMGSGQGRKKLNFDQTVVCGNCGKYGHLQVYMVYSYFSLFFIPLFRWGRSYYVTTTCCNRTVSIDAELGKQITRGEVNSLPQSIIPGTYQAESVHRCNACGFETGEDFRFCPKCGVEF